MKIRNAMCIFALFSIMVLFFCFGVVANAEESGGDTPKLNSYPYSFSYNSMSYDWGYDSFSCTCISETPLCLYITQWNNGNASAFVTGNLITSPNLGGKSVRHYNNGSTGDGVLGWSGWIDIGSVSGLPVFDGTTAEGKAAAENYLKTGKLPEDIEDGDLEAPKLVFTEQNRVFHIANSVDGYNVQIQGRFYSVDDIEMEKKTINAGVTWNYKYHTTLMGDLTDWVSVSSQTSCKEEFDILKGIGLEPLKAFLTKYPLDDRTIYGGKNSAGAWYTDRDKAVTQLKLSLSSVGVGLTQPELYVRFFYTDADGNTRYSKWTHWYGVLTNPDGTKSDILSYQSDTGLSDEEKDNLEKGGKPTENDTGTTPTYRDNDNGTSFWFKDFNPSNILTYFTNLIKTLLSATSNIAPFFNNIFGFLPAELRNVVYVTISAGCFCALIRFIFGKG